MKVITDSHGKSKLDGDLWLGMEAGKWPVQAFTSEIGVMHWLGEMSTGTRWAWKVEISSQQEVRLVKPEPFLEYAE